MYTTKDRLFDLIWYGLSTFFGILFCLDLLDIVAEKEGLKLLLMSIFGALLYSGIMSRLDEIIHNNKQK